MSSNENSQIGKFDLKPINGQAESYTIMNPVPSAIEGLDIQFPGNNCIYTPKPRIINATNIDTESVIGQIGINQLVRQFEEGSPNINGSIVEYNGYSKSLPPIGAEYAYNIIKYLWIGHKYNLEETSDVEENTFVGAGLRIPSEIPIYIDCSTPIFPVVSFPGFATTALIYGNSGGYPRSLLVIGFTLVVITQTNLHSTRYADKIFLPDGSPIYPSAEVRSIPIKLTALESIEYSDGIVFDIICDTESGTYSTYKTINVIQKNDGYPLYVSNEDPDTMDNPDICEQSSGSYYVTSSQSVWFYQIISGAIIKTNEIAIIIDLPAATDPVISVEYTDDEGADAFPATVTITKTEVNAEILYRVPWASYWTRYTGPFQVTRNGSIEAKVVGYLNFPGEYADSNIVSILISAVASTILPVISPNGGVFSAPVSVREINASIPRRIKWAWTEIDASEPAEYDETYPNPAALTTGEIVLHGFSGGIKKLWVRLSLDDDGINPTPVYSDVATAIFNRQAEDPSKGYIFSDGFDNKLICRDIEVIKPTSSSSIVLSVLPVGEPSAYYEYGEEDTIETLLANQTVPRYSQPLLITPTPFGPNGEIHPRYRTKMYVYAPWRKQVSQYDPSLSSAALDTSTSKTSMIIYSDSSIEVRINWYKYGDKYIHCFSVYVKAIAKEVFPENFTANLSDATNTVVNQVSIVSDLAAGKLKLVISYYNETAKTAYLQVEDAKNFYPGLGGSTIINYLLSEIIVSGQEANLSAVNKHELDFFGREWVYYDNGSLNDIALTIPTKTQRKMVTGIVMAGNELAVTEHQRSIFSVLGYGQFESFMTGLVNMSSVFAWPDGNERYASVMSFPMIIPFDYYWPVGSGYITIKKRSGDYDDDELFGDPETSEGHINQADVFRVFKKHGEKFEYPTSGSFHIVSTPSILIGGAYLSISETMKDMLIEFSSKSYLYGDRSEGASLHTPQGLFTPSYYSFMASTTQRLSAFGSSDEIVVLENYIFTIEADNVCLYAFSEKTGKLLLFNERGSLVDSPVIYKGSPLFAVKTDSEIKLYKGTQQGVVLSRRWVGSDAIMIYQDMSPAILIKGPEGYSVWNIDEAIYYVSFFKTERDLRLLVTSTPSNRSSSLNSLAGPINVSYRQNRTMSFEISEVYPSALSYEYENYCFFCNAIVIRTDLNYSSKTKGKAAVEQDTGIVSIKAKYNGNNILCEAKRISAKPEIKIMFDAKEVASLSYFIESTVPIRSVRFIGMFIDGIKEGESV